MATGVEKTHPREFATGSRLNRDTAKIRGFWPSLSSARPLARELRRLAHLPVPRLIDFSYSAFLL
jgi:hypothetical protein